MTDQIDLAHLSRYQPLNALSADNLQDVHKELHLITIEAGHTLFNKGDADPQQYYLYQGEIDLLGDTGILKTLKAGNPDSFNAIAHILPRTVTARAKTSCRYFKVDGKLIDAMLNWDQTGNYQIDDMGFSTSSNDDDWMSRILQTQAFQQIPPANIQAIFLRMQSVPLKAGEVIVKQGDEGDYFYVIKKGRALVTRSMPGQPQGIKLAELKDGDSFGEEALISDESRNATVTMLTNGMVNRLSRQDFLDLLNEPLLHWVEYQETGKLLAEGARWLDVRLPAEHQAIAIKDDIHIPLIFLRMKIDSLDNDIPYIVYCDNEHRSSAASFLLNERGYNTWILKGGINAIPDELRVSN